MRNDCQGEISEPKLVRFAPISYYLIINNYHPHRYFVTLNKSNSRVVFYSFVSSCRFYSGTSTTHNNTQHIHDGKRDHFLLQDVKRKMRFVLLCVFVSCYPIKNDMIRQMNKTQPLSRRKWCPDMTILTNATIVLIT